MGVGEQDRASCLLVDFQSSAHGSHQLGIVGDLVQIVFWCYAVPPEECGNNLGVQLFDPVFTQYDVLVIYPVSKIFICEEKTIIFDPKTQHMIMNYRIGYFNL